MQINIEQITLNADRSFRAYDYDFMEREQAFHAHEEYELALVSGVGGVVYCGADTTSFSSGDLFLFGGRLPHRFIGPSDSAQTVVSRARVVQFRHNAFGSSFFQLPENSAIRQLLKSSDEGLVLRAGKGASSAVNTELRTVIEATPTRRLPALLTLLAILVDDFNAGKMEIFSPGAPFLRTPDSDTERLSRLQDYIELKYADEASVDGAADELALTRTSFCRYVKRLTGRTFTELVNDYRLTVAAIMLRDSNSVVSTVSADVGFGSLSHFNSRFKTRFGTTPTEYRETSSSDSGF
jgi:AraC-like DNA-binding protein